MSFGEVVRWDDRRTCDKSKRIKGRTWVRRIRWYEDEERRVKFKLEDGEQYREVLVVGGFAKTIWDRFKGGQSIDDSVSILGNAVPKFLKSKKG